MNIFLVIAASLSTFMIGFLAHGPVTGKLWMSLANIHPTSNEKFSEMIPQMLWNLLANFVTAFMLAVMINISFMALGERSVGIGILVAVGTWLGFIVTSSSIEVIWMGRKVSLWLFECIVSLICFTVMGTILSL